MRQAIYIIVMIHCLMGFASHAQITEKAPPPPPTEEKQQATPKFTDSLDLPPPPFPTIVFKTNPFVTLWGAIPFSSEYRIVAEFVTGKQRASQLSAAYLAKSPFLTALEDSTNNNEPPFTVNGYRLQGSYKFYLNDLLKGLQFFEDFESPQGFYIGPHISYATAEISTHYLKRHDVYLRISHLNINAFAGFQMLILDNYTVDVFAGLGYKENRWVEKDFSNNISTVSTNDLEGVLGDYYNSNLKISLGFNVGIAF